MEKHDQWKNQNGFSLVELVVVMAILSIMGTVLYGFFHTSTRSYKDTGAEVDLQYEAQLTQNQLDNLIIDATKKLLYTYDTLSSNNNIVLSDAQIDNKSEVTQKNFIIDNGDEVYTLQWDLSTSKIYLLKTITKADGSRETSSPSLLAEYVKEFDVNLERVAKQRVVEFSFLYENNGKTLEIKHNITLRNRVHVNKVGSDSDVLLPTVVDKVLIYEDMHDNSFKEENNKTNKNTELKKGEKIELIAKVIGKNYPSQEVGWTLIGTPTDSSTKLTITGKNTCTFEIGTNETNKVYEIKAVSVADPSKSAVTSISLPGSDRIPGGKGFVRGGQYVLDLKSLGIDMSQVESVEWGFENVYILENGGNVRNLHDSTATHVKIPDTQMWKPLEEGQTAKDLQHYGEDEDDGLKASMSLFPNSEDIAQCTIDIDKLYGSEDLSASEAFQAVIVAKVKKKDGSVEAVRIGQNLEGEDIEKMENNSVYYAHKLAELRKDPLFMDSVHFKIIKVNDESGNDIRDQEVEFGNYADVPNAYKFDGWYGGLFIKSGESLRFQVNAYGYNAFPEFRCMDESQKTNLLDNYSFDSATGEVFLTTKPEASGQLNFQMMIPGGAYYYVPVYIDPWRETSK